MSEEDIRTAQEAFEVWNRGDYDAWVGFFDAECEFSPLRAQLEGRPYIGHEGLRQFIQDMTGEWDEIRFELQSIRDAGGQLAAVAEISARGRASGAELRFPIGLVATFRAGRVLTCRMYSDPAEAFNAAGLSL